MINYIEMAYGILMEACGHRDNFSRYDHEVFKVVIDAHMEIERLTAAMAAEREACAKIIDDNAEGSGLQSNNRLLVPRTEGNLAGTAYAAAIRARGKT